MFINAYHIVNAQQAIIFFSFYMPISSNRRLISATSCFKAEEKSQAKAIQERETQTKFLHHSIYYMYEY